MSKNALRYPESAITGGMFGTARVRGEIAGAAARLESTAAVALDAPISRLVGGALSPMQRMQELGRLPRGRMNKLETAFGQVMAARLHVGEITWYGFEAIKLRLADKTFYTPDFPAIAAVDGVLEFYEVKGRWMDDARVKIKVAAEQFPCFRFFGIRRVKGEWLRENF
jgi:hypothetical protein